MKKYLLAIFSCCVVSGAFAQLGRKQLVSLSLGVEGGKTTGGFSSTHSTGIGASAQLELGISPMLHITAYSGYLNYSGRTVQGPDGEFKYASISQVPLLAGLRLYPLTRVLYLSGQLGTTIIGSNNGSAFTYAPGVGVRLVGTDIMLRYLGINKDGNSFSSTNLRVAITL